MKPVHKRNLRLLRAQALFLICLFQVSASSLLFTQSNPDEVKNYIGMLDQSRTEDVRRALPDLVTKYQNTPELLYLEGRLAADGIEAVKFYQSVVDNFRSRNTRRCPAPDLPVLLCDRLVTAPPRRSLPN